MQAAVDRPAYVTFEKRAIEDREASIQQGKYVSNDVDYAIITPQGSKDKIERVVEEWFPYLRQQVSEGRFPAEWLRAYESIYKDWQNGQEIPENGTPIRTWPVLSPSQVKAVIEANILTVEDLACANEPAIASIGMGGRALVQRAKDYIAAAKDLGKVAEETSALRSENETLKNQLAEQAEKMKQMENAIIALQKGK